MLTRESIVRPRLRAQRWWGVLALVAVGCASPAPETTGDQDRPAEPQPAAHEAHAGSLALTRPRRPIVSPLDNMPGPDSTPGDQLIWYFDHPSVRYIVRGDVIAARGFERGGPGQIWTACTLSVARAYKGSPPATIEFEAPGGTANGTTAWSSFHADCELGDDGLFVLYQDGDRLVAAGSKEISPKFTRATTRREPPSPAWAEAVAAFLDGAAKGGAR